MSVESRGRDLDGRWSPLHSPRRSPRMSSPRRLSPHRGYWSRGDERRKLYRNPPESDIRPRGQYRHHSSSSNEKSRSVTPVARQTPSSVGSEGEESRNARDRRDSVRKRNRVCHIYFESRKNDVAFVGAYKAIYTIYHHDSGTTRLHCVCARRHLET